MLNAYCHSPSVHKAVCWLMALFEGMLLVVGCSGNASSLQVAYRRGLAENPARQKLGLRLIQSSWTCFRSIGGEDEWVTNAGKEMSAVKVVKHDSKGSLVSETDSYLSGRLVKVDDSVKLQEEIKLQADYTTSQLQIIYLGDDKEIEAWIKRADDNQARLEVIERVKAKWHSSGN